MSALWLGSVFAPDAAQNGMMYDLPLKPVGIALGLLLVVLHGLPLVRPSAAMQLLKRLPRSEAAGTVLLTIAALWAFALVWRMDLGEFAPHRRMLMLLVPVLYLGALFFMTEFLAVRALAMVLLLAANVLLDAAFMREPVTRLLLPALAYGWIGFSLFWVGMPWLLRNQIGWITAHGARFQVACVLGLLYGGAILICALLFY